MDESAEKSPEVATTAAEASRPILVVRMVFALRHVLWWSFIKDKADEVDGRVPRGAQLFYMGIVTAVGLAVIAFLKNGAAVHAIPTWVWWLEAGIALGCFAASYDAGWEFIVQIALGFKFLRVRPAGVVVPARWERFRSKYAHLLVALGVILNMFALWQVVKYTGGPLQSPFAPLLTGPALFGAFVALTVLGLFELTVGAIATILILDHDQGKSPDGDWYSFAFPQIGLLVSAFFISLFQILNDRDSRRNIGRAIVLPIPDDVLRDIGASVVAAVSGAQRQITHTPNDSHVYDDDATEGDKQVVHELEQPDENA